MSSRVATKGRAQGVLRGYAADCWLANWDVVGGQHAGENVVRSRKGRNAVARIDQGGALPFRGLQGRKSASNLEKLSEWDGFAPGGINPAYARIFERAGVADADELGHKALRQIAAIRKLGERTHGFRDLAKPVKGVDKADTDRILDLLQRRAALLDSQIAPRVRAAIRARKAARDLPAFEIEYRKEVGEERFKRSLAAAQRRVRDVNAARHGMTDPELVAVRDYTGGGYGALNRNLRSADAKRRERVGNFKRTLQAALARLPDSTGAKRRGAHLSAGEIARYRTGDEIVETFFVSSSKPFRGNAQFVIQSRRGKDVQPYSQVPSEAEVLFAADTRFRVREVRVEGETTHIELEEID